MFSSPVSSAILKFFYYPAIVHGSSALFCYINKSASVECPTFTLEFFGLINASSRHEVHWFLLFSINPTTYTISTEICARMRFGTSAFHKSVLKTFVRSCHRLKQHTVLQLSHLELARTTHPHILPLCCFRERREGLLSFSCPCFFFPPASRETSALEPNISTNTSPGILETDGCFKKMK